MLQERILKLDEDMKWWKERCKWFEGEYYRCHAALRTGDCHVRISSSLTQNVAWTILQEDRALGWCESACPICKRPLELTVWGATLQSKTHESGGLPKIGSYLPGRAPRRQKRCTRVLALTLTVPFFGALVQGTRLGPWSLAHAFGSLVPSRGAFPLTWCYSTRTMYH